MKTRTFMKQMHGWRCGLRALAWLAVVGTSCSSADDDSASSSQTAAGKGAVADSKGGKGGKGGSGSAATSEKRVQTGDSKEASAAAGKGGSSSQPQAAQVTRTSGFPKTQPNEDSRAKSKCGADDNPEKGLQGDVNTGTVNCGLTLLADIPGGGSAQGSGHCVYVRGASQAAYGAGELKAYSLADPLNPKMTDKEPGVGGSESMRANTVDGRAVLVSGRGVYDVSNCEDIVKKGEIKWPSESAMNGIYFAALSSHEIAISHDAKRVYTGLGFAVANIENLSDPKSWVVHDWACEMNKQSGFPTDVPNSCDGPVHLDVGRQYSHSSDDNLEGTVWYGANQNGDGFSAMEPATARMVDISDPDKIKILDTVHEFPGHSMNWWRTPDGREFIVGANEGGGGGADSCQPYPRPTNLGNDMELYAVEVTGKKFGEPFIFTLDINKPENCEAAKKSGGTASVSEHSVYNKGDAAFIMVEFGRAGLRVFDLRDGEHPKEVAYYNDGKGHVHSGVFSYDEKRGIMIASGSQATHVLMLEPQAIEALGLPKPTDPKYPYK